MDTFQKDVSQKENPGRSALRYECWTSSKLSQGNEKWGPVFAQRINLVKAQKGTIYFIGDGIDPKRAATAYNILYEMLMTGGPLASQKVYDAFLAEFRKAYPCNDFYHSSKPNGETTCFELAYLLISGDCEGFQFIGKTGEFIDTEKFASFAVAFKQKAKQQEEKEEKGRIPESGSET